MTEYKKLLETALQNITEVRQQIIQQIETEHQKQEPNESRIYHLTDYKIELLDTKLRLQSLIKNIHTIEEEKI